MRREYAIWWSLLWVAIGCIVMEIIKIALGIA